MKKWMKLVAAAALVGALTVSAPGISLSANLTGGSYTYVIHGEEVIFPFDPIVRKEGLLLPIDVFQQFGIKVDGALTQEITLSKDAVEVRLTLGQTPITVSGRPDTVATPGMRVSGRLFLPADLLRQFGIEFGQDGTYVVMRAYADSLGAPDVMSDGDYARAKGLRTASGIIKTDSGVYMNGEFTLLSAELINAANMGLAYGTRARLLNLLQNNTLVLVKLSNTSYKAGAVAANGLYLVDSERNQYDTPTVVDIGGGPVTGKVAPGADRVGVLVYPQLADDAGAVTLYYDANGATLGTFSNQ